MVVHRSIMEPRILFRPDQDTQEEFETVKSIWGGRVFQYRSDLPSNSLVIGRYSVLPFYKELDEELGRRNSQLINRWYEHRFIADMEWVAPLSAMTPKTWFDMGWANVPDTEHGWVVKGRTNSRKFQWNTHMYARTREDLQNVFHRLHDDQMLANQGLVVREYVPLKQLEEGINGMPVTNEWRFFFLHGEMLSAGYYWSQAECAEKKLCPVRKAGDLACAAAKLIADHATFCVIDVAETEDGRWIVIEVNDGQMSGLSMNDSQVLYQNLWEALS